MIPKPPGIVTYKEGHEPELMNNPDTTKVKEAIEEQHTAIINANVKIPKDSGELTEDEGNFIMRDTLKEVHLNDPSVIEFIDAFIRCKSIPQASAECGIHPSLGFKYRHRQDIANCISKLIAKSAVKHGFDASEVLERAKEIADVDPIHVQNRDGTFKSNLHDMPAEVRRCLKKLKVKNLYDTQKDMNGIDKKIIIGELIEYEFYDKIKAIDLVGKEKDMFKSTTKVEHGVTKDMAKILLDSSARAQKAIENQAGVVPVEFNIVGENDE